MCAPIVLPYDETVADASASAADEEEEDDDEDGDDDDDDDGDDDDGGDDDDDDDDDEDADGDDDNYTSYSAQAYTINSRLPHILGKQRSESFGQSLSALAALADGERVSTPERIGAAMASIFRVMGNRLLH